MKVILLKDIKGLGRKFEEKEVSDGHAINMLIPKKFAVPATGAAGGHIKNLKDNELKSKEAELNKLRNEIQKLSGIELIVIAKANEKNILFASLTKEKIADILMKEKGIKIDPKCITTNSIKELGSYEIKVLVENDKESHFNLIVQGK